VDRDAVGAGLRERGDVALGPIDHQVHVEVAARVADGAGQGLDHGGPHAQRGHEVTVHDVDVDRARPRGEHLGDLRAQVGGVRREHGGSHAGRPARHQMGWSIELRQWLQAYRAVLDMRTIVECSPQLGHTEASSKRRRQFTHR
jgi:hypothetical protein